MANEHDESVLLIGDEWSPTRGGISQYNRRLAIEVAEAGYPTACLVHSATLVERTDARAHGVKLFTAMPTPSGPELAIPAPKVIDWNPTVIIGHDVITGTIAWIYARYFVPTASLVYVAHTAPSQNEPYKHADAAARLSNREREIREIAKDADVVAAVGPLLTRRTEAVVGDGPGDIDVLRLDPGMDVPVDGGAGPRRPPSNPIMLMVCRTTYPETKGIDIAAHAVATMHVPYGRPKPELRIRGAHGEECDTLRRELVTKYRLARNQVDVRAYSADPKEIAHDLRQAALFLMPSRAEGFGLAALEAIGLSTPVLVSERSGLAELLRQHLGPMADPMIVPVVDDDEHDIPTWRAAIERKMDNLTEAFAYAHDIRTRLAGVLKWDNAVRELLSRLPGTTTPATGT
jgi:glycosyltransferase involved in cell wall biosynthesis